MFSCLRKKFYQDYAGDCIGNTRNFVPSKTALGESFIPSCRCSGIDQGEFRNPWLIMHNPTTRVRCQLGVPCEV